MADNDLTNQLEDIFSDSAVMSETEGSEDVPLLRGMVTDLLEGEAGAEPAISEARTRLRRETHAQSGPVAEEHEEGFLLEEAVAALFENDPASTYDVVEPVAPTPVTAKPEEVEEREEVRPARVSSLKVAPTEARIRFLSVVSYILFILLGLILISLLIGVIWKQSGVIWKQSGVIWKQSGSSGPTLVAGSVYGTLYLAGCVVAVAIAVIQWRFNVSLADDIREAEEEHAEALDSQMQLQELVQELNTVNTVLQKRAVHLESANQVLHALNPTLEPDQLVQEAVKQVRDGFDLYYVGLFLIDEAGQSAVLRASTLASWPGETGKVDHQMLSQGYRLEVGGASIVGRCTAKGQALIVLDLDEETYHHDYTLLPNAHSEMALPLQTGGRTIGVLDLQSIQRRAFSQEDSGLFQTLADQLATAIDNAQKFVELETRLEAALPREFQPGYIREGQSGFPLGPVASLYERTGSGVTPLGDKAPPEVEQALTQQDLIRQEETKDGESRSVVVAPISLRGEVIGALGFHEEDSRQWTDDEIALIEDVTTQVSLAVENVRLFEQTQAALDETDALYRASRAIASADDVEGILHAIVDSLASPRLDQCFLGIFDSPGGKLSDDLVIVSSWSQASGSPWHVGTQLSLNRDLIGEQIGRDRPLILSDVAAESGLEETKRDELMTAGIRSLAVVPLVAAGGWIGVLCLAATRAGAITERNLQPYLTLAGQAALSIERNSLFKKTQMALEETSMLYQASRAIGAATSIPEVANVLLNSVDEGGFERGLVLVRRQVDDEFEVVAGWDRSGRPVEVGAQMDVNQVSPNLVIYSDLTQQDAPSNHRALDGVWRRWVTEREGAALASVPILFRGSPLGILLVESCHPDQLSEETLQPFVTLAAQAAVAVENRHLFDETRRAAEQETLLNEMLRNLATALNVPAIVDIVQDPLARLVPFDHMSVALVDKETATLEVFHPGSEQAEDGHGPPKGRIGSLQETLTGQVIETGKTTVFDLTDPNLVGLEIEPLRRGGAQTCIAIPMVYGRDVMGSLNLAHSSLSAYVTADVPLLERVAQLTAVALENARLFGQLSQRAVQLQTAAQVSQAATSILNLDQLMTETVELIRDRFDLYYVGLFMVDAADEWAVLRAGTGEAGRIQLDQKHRLKIGGESMIGWCVANAQPRIAYDVGEEATRFDNPVLPDTRSELALPLISRGETIGALTVQSIFPTAFSREDVTTLQTMADQLANAIQNARFFERTQKALAETESLYMASAELNTAHSYQDILGAVCRHTMLGTSKNATICLFDRPWTQDEKPERVDVVAHWGEVPSEDARPRHPMSLFGPWAAQLLRPDDLTLFEDIASDSRIQGDLRADLLQRYDARGAVFAPLVAGGQWIGNISAFYQEPTIFPEAEIRRLTALSGQAAVVVQGLRQLQEIQGRARREALIREITGKIRASTDLETILQTTVTEVSRALGTSHGAIRLGTEEAPEMENSRKPSETSQPDLPPLSYAEYLGASRRELHHSTGDSRGDGVDEPGQKPQGKTAQEPTSPSGMDKGGQE